MGGGDLNLKKSWHPSTMRNMEKVWKAEQKHDLEKKRIAELQREIQQEKAREDMKKFAEDQGVLEKKSDVKLDWMYKGPGTNVDHEEYLLGKAIDKNFEQLQRSQQQNAASICVPGRSDTCLPGSIFAGSGEQVDIARKLQEDPLLAIRKKEIESRSQILKNPVKLKQLKEMIKKQKSSKHSKHKKEKKKKKKSKKKSKRSSSSDDTDDSDLDAKLLAKYQKLKEKLGGNALSMLQKSPKRNESENKGKHRKRSNNSNSDSSSSDEVERTHEQITARSYGLQLPHGAKPNKSASVPNIASEESKKSCDKEKSSNQYQPPRKQKLTEEEKERRRQEMLADGASRERERKSNVARYREAERKEQAQGKRDFSDDFMREQISKVTAHSSVASRIKSNINNIQRSGGSMDKNFARR